MPPPIEWHAEARRRCGRGRGAVDAQDSTRCAAPRREARSASVVPSPRSHRGMIGSRMSQARATTMIGKRLGHYEVVGQLGVGGMGEVYRARDANLAREVAIKILPAAVAGDTDRLARFAREAK